jgi:hypothetical protein
MKRISSRACHSAFCDLLRTSDGMLACYRQATNHVSADGRIETCLIDSEGNVSHRQRLWLDNVDLRDPKLSYLPNGRMVLIAYARHTTADNKTRFAQSLCWTSQDGKSWSSPRYFGPQGWWLWRLTWYKDMAYGFAYNRGAEQIDLYAGHPFKTMNCVKRGALSKLKQGYGYPNESDIWFSSETTMHAIVRRDADSYSALYGISHAPYTQWQWYDLHTYIGGPKVIVDSNENIYVAGRGLVNNTLKTCLWQFCQHKKTLTLKTILPSGGDNSYPGLVLQENTLRVLYYSSHIDNQSRVYLAETLLNKR